MFSGCLFVFPAKSFWRLWNDSERGLCFLAVVHTLSLGKLTAPTAGLRSNSERKRSPPVGGAQNREKRSCETPLFSSKVVDAKSARAIGDQFSLVRGSFRRFAGGGARNHTHLLSLEFSVRE